MFTFVEDNIVVLQGDRVVPKFALGNKGQRL